MQVVSRVAGAITVLLIGSFCGVAQSATGAQSFHWVWRNAQERFGRQSLRNARITENQKHEIAAAIEIQLRSEYSHDKIDSDDEMQPGETLRARARDTRIELVDLNGDGISEVIAQGSDHVDCSPTGNCPFWIFQKSPHGYKPLLDGFGQTFTVQKHVTNGFHDIVVSTHHSATESGLAEFRYDGECYHQMVAYVAEWEGLKDGFEQKLSEPQVIRYDGP